MAIFVSHNSKSNLIKMKSLYFLLIFSVLVSKSTCAQTRKIIDVHFHTRSVGDYGVIPPPNPITKKLPKASSNEEIYNSTSTLLKK